MYSSEVIVVVLLGFRCPGKLRRVDWKFSKQVSGKFPNMNFPEINSKAFLLVTCGRTDKQEEPNIRTLAAVCSERARNT